MKTLLEKSLFKKHTILFLYMIIREYFSQKELILYSLKNNEFKDKDSIENKGQFLDKLIDLKVIEKYNYRDFMKKFPSKINDASKAYIKSHERKRVILEFKIMNFLALEFPLIKKIKNELPFKEYINEIYNIEKNELKINELKIENFFIKDIIKSFLIGCSLANIYFFPKYEKMNKILKKYTLNNEIKEQDLILINIAKRKIEKILKY